MEQWFRPMGLNLRVSTNSSKLAGAVCDAYAVFGAGDRNAAADLQFDFADNADHSMARTHYRVSPHAAELRMGEHVVLSIDPGGCARGCFPEDFVDDRSGFRLHALHFALSAALARRGFLGVHAACVAINGNAVLLRGPQGAGKTVLAHAAASRGFQVITGSTVWITPNDDAWWGIPRWIHLRHSARCLFPEIAEGPEVRVGDEVKIEVDLAQAYSGGVRPGIIVFLERCPNEPAYLETMQPSQALLVWKRGEAGNEVSAPDYETRIARLLRTRSYRLNSGDDIHRALDLIAAAALDQAC